MQQTVFQISLTKHLASILLIFWSTVTFASATSKCENLFSAPSELTQTLERDLEPAFEQFRPAFQYLLRSPELKWIAKQWREEQISFAMNAGSEIREKILENGFLNQYESKSSGGEYDPKLREAVEAEFLGLPLKEYQKTPYSERAKYAYLAPPPKSKMGRIDASQYGNDIYRFKTQALKDFVTVTAGDSLEIYQNVKYDLKSTSIHHKRFIPWKMKDFILPVLRTESSSQPKLEIQSNDIVRSAVVRNGDVLMPESRVYDQGNTYYIEVQIWKRLTIDDLESLSFIGEPPQGAFLKALQEKGVIIYERKFKSKLDAFFNNDETESIWWEPK